MYNESQDFNLKKLKGAFRLYKKPAILLGLAIMALVVFGNKSLIPDEYEAKALVRAKTTLSEDPRERVSIVREEILSHKVLSDVVEELNLQQSPSQPTAFVNLLDSFGVHVKRKTPSKGELIRWIGDAAIVYPAESRGRDDVFVVAFTGDDPDTASNIVNSIVTNFIEDKIGNKAIEAERTYEFLTMQTERKAQQLHSIIDNINDFRDEHGNILSQGETLGDALRSARSSLIDAEAKLAEASTWKQDLLVAIRNEPKTILTEASTSSDFDRLSPSEKLAKLRNDLASYRSRYTPQHPDIIRTEREISKLERVVRSTRYSNAPTPATVGTPNPEYQALQSELRRANASQRAAYAEIARYKEEVNRLESKLTRLPALQQQMQELYARRDDIKDEYEALKRQLTDVELAYNAVSTDLGSNFRIIDSAVPPSSPLIGSRLVFHLFGIVMGIGAVALFLLGAVVFRGEEIENAKSSTGSVVANVLFYLSAFSIFFLVVGYIAADFVSQMYTFV